MLLSTLTVSSSLLPSCLNFAVLLWCFGLNKVRVIMEKPLKNPRVCGVPVAGKALGGCCQSFQLQQPPISQHSAGQCY